jgi:hypothetical protein
MPIAINANLVPKNGGPFPLIEDLYIQGGLRICVDEAQRDNIPVASRKDGMVVITANNRKWWSYNSISESFAEITELSIPKIASTEVLGTIRVGAGLDVDQSGLLSVPTATAQSLGLAQAGQGLNVSEGVFSIPLATAQALGLVRIGNGVIVDQNGVISIPLATTQAAGLVRAGSGTSVDQNGTISVPISTPQTPGLVRPGTGLTVDQNGILNAAPAVPHSNMFFDNGDTSANITIDVSRGKLQRVRKIGLTAITLNFSNWAAAGTVGELVLELVDASDKVSISGVNWILPDGSFTTSFINTGLTMQSSGTDFIILWTRDGGTTVYAKLVR